MVLPLRKLFAMKISIHTTMNSFKHCLVSILSRDLWLKVLNVPLQAHALSYVKFYTYLELHVVKRILSANIIYTTSNNSRKLQSTKHDLVQMILLQFWLIYI